MAAVKPVANMAPQLLEYRSPDPRRQRRWLWRIVLYAAVPLAVMFVLSAISVRQTESRMDAVTGSITWKTIWLSGITTGSRVDVSPLETRLRNGGTAWTPSWRLLHDTHRNIFGSAIRYECGSAPVIYQFQPLLKQFSTTVTDEEIRQFVRIMQAGSEREQKAAIDAAADRFLRSPQMLQPNTGSTLTGDH